MKRFVLTLVGLSFAMMLIIVGMHVVAVYNLRDEVEDAYTLDPAKDILFIGSSQVGCSIEESPRFHNQKLWVSDTISQSFLMRLKELERRNQLKKIKVCVVPFNLFSITSQAESSFLWAWYQELPVSWRYLDMLPCGLVRFVSYIASNLRFPFHIHVSDSASPQDPLIQKPEGYRRTKMKMFVEDAQKQVDPHGHFPDWEHRLIKCYDEMLQICKRNDVRLIVYKAPVISCYENAIPNSGKDKVVDVVGKLQACGIEYVDTGLSFGEECFRDHVHLVHQGASVFTDKIYEVGKLDVR